MGEHWQRAAELKSLNLKEVDVAETGHWFCFGCHAISEPLEPGDPYLKCIRCKREKLEWRDPVRRNTKTPGNRTMIRKNFGLLAATPFYFCNACGRITALTGARRCILCSGWDVVLQDPNPNAPQIPPEVHGFDRLQVAEREQKIVSQEKAHSKFEAARALVDAAVEHKPKCQ